MTVENGGRVAGTVHSLALLLAGGVEMQALLVIGLILACAGLAIYGLFLLVLRRGRRRRGLYLISGAIISFFVGMVALIETDAVSSGFASSDDQKAAKTAGVSDPAVWAAMQAEVARVAEIQKAADAVEFRRAGRHCVSAWDGHHAGVIEQLVATLRDPDSFEAIDTNIRPVRADGKHLLSMKYRAKNGFGGFNVGEVTGLIDHETCVGEIISTVDQ